MAGKIEKGTSVWNKKTGKIYKEKSQRESENGREDELGGIEFYIKTAVEKQEPRLLVTKVSHLLENNELKIRVDFEVPEFEMKDSLSMGVSKNAG